MQDQLGHVEKLLADAAECETIANLIDDKARQKAARELADQYKNMALRIRAEIDARKLSSRSKISSRALSLPVYARGVFLIC